MATRDISAPYLKIRDLTKNFGTFTALKDVSLDVAESEFVCFLGPSGCGKTTLLRAIAGLDIQTTGTIEQNGKDISALPPAERDFGIVFQSYAGRIRLARERAQIDPAELRARLKDQRIELSKTGLHRLETTEPRNPNLKLIEAIAQITRVSPGWLLFGRGPSVPESEVGSAIRSRVIDTIELMSGALDLTTQQQKTLANWLRSVRETRPEKVRDL